MQDIVYPKVGFIQRYKKTNLLPPLPQKNLCCINETIKNKSPDLRVIRQILHLVSQFLWLSRIKSEFKSQIAIKIQFKSAYCIQFVVFYRNINEFPFNIITSTLRFIDPPPTLGDRGAPNFSIGHTRLR